MADDHTAESPEDLIAEWRRRVRRLPADELAALETKLRREIAGLTALGLAVDEAFLVAEKRVGRRDAAVESASDAPPAARTEALVAFGCAVLAGVAIKMPALFGINPNDHDAEGFYFRNASLFVLPWLVAYFVWKRSPAPRTAVGLAGAFGVAALFANLPGFGPAPSFTGLTALHLPIALWLAVGIAHAGGKWSEASGRMDFIRFSGELFIYYVLIALGGIVLTAFMALTFRSIGINIGPFVGAWVIPCGATGAIVIASWLVETKQRVMDSMAPMLTRLFAPLFAAMLVAFLGTLLWSGRGIAIERELLIGFDLLLVVVLGLLLYSISARDPTAPPGAFDAVQLVLVLAALIADAFALSAIGARIHEFGFSPNRVAALGENLILLINLAWSAVLYGRWMLGRGAFPSLERWQTRYVPIYSAWAAIVVIAFPPLFRWIG